MANLGGGSRVSTDPESGGVTAVDTTRVGSPPVITVVFSAAAEGWVT